MHKGLKGAYLPPSFVYDMRTRWEAKYDAHAQMHDDGCCPEDCLICEEIEDKREARRVHLTNWLKKLCHNNHMCNETCIYCDEIDHMAIYTARQRKTPNGR